jgi:hypothetical protein
MVNLQQCQLTLRAGIGHSQSFALASEILNWKYWGEGSPTYGEQCSYFLDIVKRFVAEGGGDPENIRFVFWFDS